MPESPLSLDDGKQLYMTFSNLLLSLARFTEMMNLLQVTILHFTHWDKTNFFSIQKVLKSIAFLKRKGFVFGTKMQANILTSFIEMEFLEKKWTFSHDGHLRYTKLFSQKSKQKEKLMSRIIDTVFKNNLKSLINFQLRLFSCKMRFNLGTKKFYWNLNETFSMIFKHCVMCFDRRIF